MMIKIPSITPTTMPVPHRIDAPDDTQATSPVVLKAPHHEALRPPLATSMEEIAMAFGEQAERRSKSINRRHISQTDIRALANVERIEKLTELSRLLENPAESRPGQQVDRMRRLLTKSPPPTVEDILQAAGNDPARGDVLLRQVISQTQQDEPNVAAAAEQALQQLHQEKGPEVRAGLNTASAIDRFSTNPEHKQAIRDLYYQKIVHQQSASALLDALLERFGAKHFPDALHTLQSALSADIASLAPSLPKVALRKMLGNLKDSCNLSHTLSVSKQILDRLSTKLQKSTLNEVELTRRLIGLSANGAYARDLHNLGREVAGTQPQHQTLFFNALLPLVNNLPQSLWRDPKNRQTALQLIRGLIGDTVQYENKRATLSPDRKFA